MVAVDLVLSVPLALLLAVLSMYLLFSYAMEGYPGSISANSSPRPPPDPMQPGKPVGNGVGAYEVHSPKGHHQGCQAKQEQSDNHEATLPLRTLV